MRQLLYSKAAKSLPSVAFLSYDIAIFPYRVLAARKQNDVINRYLKSMDNLRRNETSKFKRDLILFNSAIHLDQQNCHFRPPITLSWTVWFCQLVNTGRAICLLLSFMCCVSKRICMRSIFCFAFIFLILHYQKMKERLAISPHNCESPLAYE